MLLIHFFIFLMIGYSIYGGVIQDNDENHDDDRAFSGKAGKYFTRRCMKHSDLGQLEEVLKELRAIKKCFVKTLPTHTTDDEEGLQERCLEQREEVIKCLRQLMDIIAPCLPPEESYLPDFVIKAYKGYSEYFCEHVHVLTLTGLLETNIARCINRFMKHPSYNPQYHCYESAKFANHSREEPITKADLCEDLDFVYDCYEEKFKEHCPDAPKAWEFEKGLINGLRSPCNEEEPE